MSKHRQHRRHAQRLAAPRRLLLDIRADLRRQLDAHARRGAYCPRCEGLALAARRSLKQIDQLLGATDAHPPTHHQPKPR